MHELGRNFVEEVIDVRETEASTAEEAAKGHHLQFKSQIQGWKGETHDQVRAFLLGLKDVGLRQHLVRSNGGILFHRTADMWPTITPRFEKDGWWYAACDEVTHTNAVHAEIGDWKVNPSRRLEVMPITRHARHALREGPGTRNYWRIIF